MKPLKDRVIMRQLKAKEETKGGLIIPDGAKKKPNLAVVLWKGPEANTVHPGDMVVLGSKWFTNFDMDNQDLLILNEPDLLSVLEPDERAKMEAEYGL